jgi:hypothetical protein
VGGLRIVIPMPEAINFVDGRRQKWPKYHDSRSKSVTKLFQGKNWGPTSGSQIGVPNRGPKSGSQIGVPNWIAKSKLGSQIGVPNRQT